MNNEDKITLSLWNQLSQKEKEKLKKWTLDNGYALDVIPTDSGSFGLSCDYAALLTSKQLITYINHTSKNRYIIAGRTLEDLWRTVKELLEN